MNTTNNSQPEKADSFQANPFGLAIGAALALTATFGILSAYIFGAGNRPRYWMTIAIFFVITTIIGYIVAKARQNN